MLALAAALMLALPALAQVTEEDFEPVGPPNEAYMDAIWGKGVQSEIIYLRPSAPFKADEKVRIDVPREDQDSETSGAAVRWTIGLIAFAVFAAIVYVFVVNSNSVGVSFRTTRDDNRRGDATGGQNMEEDDLSGQPLDEFLTRLAAMADKREALILLVSRALQRAADMHNLRLGRAQTARDVLRILPVAWPHMQTMRGLVREAEIVHFGGRDITSERWEECLDAARPIFHGQTA